MAQELDEEKDSRNDAEVVIDDRKADIRAAFDSFAEEADSPEAPETNTQRAERIRDEKGRFQPKAEAKETEPAEEPVPPKGRARQSAPAELETPEVKGKAGKPETAAPKADPVDNVPASFKPGMLEDWKAVPRAVREEIHRREAESYALLEQTKGQRQALQQIQEAVQPYQALLQAEGGSVPTALRNYLQAATLMRQGSPLAKAQWIAKLTRTFTSQEHLGLLDQAVAAEFGVGGAQAPNQEPQGYRPPQQEFRDPRVDEMLARQQQAQQQEWQQGFQEAQSEKDAWVTERQPEFLPWVKNRMATLLETAARDGEELGFEEAYDAACRTHPEVRKILTQREEAARAQPSAIQRSRRASVSLRPQGAVAPSGGSEGNSRRSDIEEAWDAVMGR